MEVESYVRDESADLESMLIFSRKELYKNLSWWTRITVEVFDSNTNCNSPPL